MSFPSAEYIRMPGIIYVTRCLINDKLYVGLHTHGKKDYLGSGHALAFAIKKYGRANFVRTELDTFLTLEEGQAKERRWIVALGSKAPDGYNLCDGGEGVFNPSEETRAKRSVASKGNKNRLGHRHTDATRAKISANNGMKRPEARAKISAARKGQPVWIKGKHHTDEAKNKNRMAHLGKHYSDTTKAKMRMAHLGMRCSDETKQKHRAAALGNTNGRFTRGILKPSLIGNANAKGQRHSEEWKAVQRERMMGNVYGRGNKGKPISPDARENRRKALLLRWAKARQEADCGLSF